MEPHLFRLRGGGTSSGSLLPGGLLLEIKLRCQKSGTEVLSWHLMKYWVECVCFSRICPSEQGIKFTKGWGWLWLFTWKTSRSTLQGWFQMPSVEERGEARRWWWWCDFDQRDRETYSKLLIYVNHFSIWPSPRESSFPTLASPSPLLSEEHFSLSHQFLETVKGQKKL